jgi:hypothetical protein
MGELIHIPARRTKRRYAHELYPHAADGEVRPLSVEVPYLYARALGFEVHGTGWFDAEPQISMSRTHMLINAREIAFLAEALAQDLVGDEAWAWAQWHAEEESGELVYEGALRFDVDVEAIKPYPCGPSPDHHDHLGEPDARGNRLVNRAPGTEDDCEECTEVIA